MKKREERLGFSLLEMMVSVALFAMLASTLYLVFGQMKRSVSAIGSTIDTDESLAIIYNQLDKDIAALCIPNAYYAQALEEDQKKQAEAQKKGASRGKEAKEEGADKSEDDVGGKKDEKEPEEKIPTLDKAFFLESKNGGQWLLTFFTTNTLQEYGTSKPYFSRIVYQLEPMPQGAAQTDEKVYKLVRTEVDGLPYDQAAIAKSNSYSLGTQLKNVKIILRAPEPEPEEKPKKESADSENNDEKDEAVKKPKKLIELTSWNDEASKKHGQFAPSFIRITGERWDAQKKKAFPFEFEFKCYAKTRMQLNRSEDFYQRIEEFANKLSKMSAPPAAGEKAPGGKNG